MPDKEEKNTNVTSFADFRKKKDEETTETASADAAVDSDFYFAEMQKANADKKRMMDEERKKANKGVIRSYKLK